MKSKLLDVHVLLIAKLKPPNINTIISYEIIGDKMELFNKFNKIGAKMKWYDFSLLKLCVLFFTLFLITAWPAFRSLVFNIEWFWFLIIAVILMILLLKKIFCK